MRQSSAGTSAGPELGRLADAGGVRISARGVERVFATRKGAEIKAVGPLDIEVRDGEFLCIVGPSGCGKSTFLRLVGGLVRPTSGTIDIAHQDPSSHLVSVVFQDHSIFPWQTVAQNVRTGLDFATRLNKKEKTERIRHWLDRMGLSDFSDAYPATLSGGMKQRVSLARALAVNPEVLLMDEPFAALDAQLRVVLQDELIALWEGDRRTVVFVTHALDEAVFLGDRIIIMSARPGVVKAEIEVPFARPRSAALRGTPEFAKLVQATWDVLRTEVRD